MTRKRWGMLTLSLLILSLSLMVLAVVIVDPFEIYHQATAFIPPIDNGTQNYSNAGIAKSYAYDSVMIGSSMTENFRPSQLDSLFGGQFVKLPINGGPPFNHKQMLDMAFTTHDVKRVLYGLDVDMFTYFYSTPKCEMPDYLYDDNLFNDVRYWFNKSVLTSFIPRCLATLGQSNPDLRDDMYSWDGLYPTGRDAVLHGETLKTGRVEQDEIPAVPTPSQQTKLNIEHNLIPMIKAHPDTQFVFFYPPYSLVRWYQFYRSGNLGYHLAQKEALADALLSYENVRIFDFTGNTDWIVNLDLYIDSYHYIGSINDAMAEFMASDAFRVHDVGDVRKNDALLQTLCEALADGVAWEDMPDTVSGLSAPSAENDALPSDVSPISMNQGASHAV